MIKAKAFAKLNLNLHLFPEKDEYGFYPVKFVNCELNLHDELYFEKQKNKIDLICDNKKLSNKNNLVYKTALLLKKVVKDKSLGVKITLKKNIPIKAGLGGGSSDAAVTLRNLIKLWKIKLNKAQVQNINKQIGSDVAFCYKGGVCSVTNQGSKNVCVYSINNNCLFSQEQCFAIHSCDQACKLSRVPRLWVVLIVPEKQKKSTEWMYKNVNQTVIGNNLGKYAKLIEGMKEKNKDKIFANLHNDFEDIVRQNNKEMLELEKQLDDMDADKVFIAGSGLTVVGLYKSKKKSLTVFRQLKIKYKNVIWTYTR